MTSPRRASQASQATPYPPPRRNRRRRRFAVFYEDSETDERARLQQREDSDRQTSQPLSAMSWSGSSVASERDAIEDRDSPEPTPAHAAIRLFCQFRRHEAPQPIEIYFFDKENDNDHSDDDNDESPQGTIRLVVPADPSDNPRKRRRENNNEHDGEEEEDGHDEDGGERSKKRSRILPAASATFGNGTVEVRLLRRPLTGGEQEGEHECLGLPVDGYMMDLGLVRVFPEIELDSEVEDETAADDGDGHATSILAVIVTVTVTIILVVGVGVALILLIVYSPSSNPASQASITPFQPVNWAHEAAMIEIELASLSRIMIFGETCMEELRWHGSPGLRPDGGYSHFNRSLEPSPYVPPQWYSDSPLRPTYKPWETTSSGTYVPETWFLEDLRHVMSSLKIDLEYLADHGPLSFRFTQGRSTQFRWSTEGFNFLPPHDSLPTLNPEDLSSPAATVHGLPSYEPGHSHPDPTARPENTYDIENLDPPLSQLIRDWDSAWTDLGIWHNKAHQRLATFYVQMPEGRAAWQLLGMYESKVKQRQEDDPDWVSGDTVIRHVVPVEASSATENIAADTLRESAARAKLNSKLPSHLLNVFGL